MQNSKLVVETPSLKRRLIALVYETFLVTAVVMLGLFLFLLAAQGLAPGVKEIAIQFVLFIVAGVYFIYCWTDSGHTLAMKTWHIKLVKVGHKKVPVRSAVLRYLLAWGWVLPAIIVCWAFGLRGKEMALTVTIGVIGWSLTVFLDKDRQFLHDKLAGTRLISLPKQAKAAAKAV